MTLNGKLNGKFSTISKIGVTAYYVNENQVS